MTESLKAIAITCATFIAIALVMAGYNIHTDAKRRDAYLECLKSNERVMALNPNASGSSCYLR